MGAHAICDETKCKIPVYPKTETYSKTEVNNLINKVYDIIDRVQSDLNSTNSTINSFGTQQNTLHAQIGERFDAIETQLYSIINRLNILEEKVGG